MIRYCLPVDEATAMMGDARALALAAQPHASPYGNPLGEPMDPVGLAQAQERARIRLRMAVQEGWLGIPMAVRLAAAHAVVVERVALGDDAPLEVLLGAHRRLLLRAQRRWCWRA